MAAEASLDKEVPPVIIGSKAQNAVWAESVEWPAKRSGKTPVGARRRMRKTTKRPSRSKKKVA